jgi:hypothetical protein
MKGKTKQPANTNTSYEEEIPISGIEEKVVYDDDGEGVLFQVNQLKKLMI